MASCAWTRSDKQRELFQLLNELGRNIRAGNDHALGLDCSARRAACIRWSLAADTAA
jgi:hypothetical protein